MSNRTKFVEKESNFSARVKSRWRLPRGKHSKVRQMHKGRPALPGPGYGSQESKKGLHPSGLKIVAVSCVADLDNVDVKTEGIIISKNVGDKKKVEIVKIMIKKSIKSFNLKDEDVFLKKIESDLVSRKKLRSNKKTKKSKKVESGKKKDSKKTKSDQEDPKASEVPESKKTETKKEVIDKVKQPKENSADPVKKG